MTAWTYEIKTGPDGEENYVWVHDEAGGVVCVAKTHHASRIVKAVNAVAHVDGIYKGAIDNLNHHQRQLDADGIDVGVSRQALCEVLAGLEAALALPSALSLPAQGWRDMASAPRDGRWVWLWNKHAEPGNEAQRFFWSTHYSVFGLGGCWTDHYGSTMGDGIDFDWWRDTLPADYAAPAPAGGDK